MYTIIHSIEYLDGSVDDWRKEEIQLDSKQEISLFFSSLCNDGYVFGEVEGYVKYEERDNAYHYYWENREEVCE